MPLTAVHMEAPQDWACQSNPEHPSVEHFMFHLDTYGLSECDYAASWQLEPHLQHPVMDYPLMHNDIFEATVSEQKMSMADACNEGTMHLCPADLIRLPPGLEDMAPPGGLAALEMTLRCKAEGSDTHEESDDDVLLDAHHLPKGLLDSLDPEAPQFVPASMNQLAPWSAKEDFSTLDPEAPQFVPATIQQLSPWSVEEESLTLDQGASQFVMASVQLDPEAPQFVPASMQQPEPWHVEDRMPALESLVVPAPQPQVFNTQFATSPVESVPEPVLGSLDCPTVGSQAHQLGACRPCAFMFTKGCNNGVLCPFCHLCDPAERKRRAKDKRAAQKPVVLATR